MLQMRFGTQGLRTQKASAQKTAGRYESKVTAVS
jgi:hypothetical protein